MHGPREVHNLHRVAFPGTKRQLSTRNMDRKTSLHIYPNASNNARIKETHPVTPNSRQPTATPALNHSFSPNSHHGFTYSGSRSALVLRLGLNTDRSTPSRTRMLTGCIVAAHGLHVLSTSDSLSASSALRGSKRFVICTPHVLQNVLADIPLANRYSPMSESDSAARTTCSRGG